MFSRYLLEKRHRIFQAKRKKSFSCKFPNLNKDDPHPHEADRLGLFYGFCCCFQSPCSSVREFLEILRISTTDQTKIPLNLISTKTATFFFSPRFFNIQISQPGSKAGQFCSGRLFGRFFFLKLHDSAPMTFSALALPMF